MVSNSSAKKRLRIRHDPKRDGMSVLSHRRLHIFKRIHHESVSLIKCNPSGFQFTGRQFHLQYNRLSALRRQLCQKYRSKSGRFGMISSRQSAPQTGMYQTPTLPETPSVPMCTVPVQVIPGDIQYLSLRLPGSSLVPRKTLLHNLPYAVKIPFCQCL